MSYTLCVIDMQHYFTASRSTKVQKACAREIKKAMKDKATILFVEYDTKRYGATLPELTELTSKYKKTHTATKYANGGGDIINQFLTKKHLPKMNIKVCGVNTNYCVRETVSDMNSLMKNSNIHIISDACNSTTIDGHKHGLKMMKDMSNVKIVQNKV